MQSGTSSFHFHIFLCLCLHDTETTFRSPYKSFWNSIRMKLSLWYKISFWYNVNRHRTSLRIDCVSDLAQNPASRNALDGVVRFYYVNAAQTSLWNKIHFGMKVIPVSYKHPLSKNKFTRQGIIVSTLKQSFS